MSAGQLDAFGWRIAFLAGAIILPFGLILRRNLPETHGTGAVVGEELFPADGKISMPALVVLGLIILASGTTVSYVLDYMATYSTETLHMAAYVGFVATMITGASGLIFDLTSGLLSDRFGRKPVMMIPWAVLAVTTVPAFTIIARDRSVTAVILMVAVLSISASVAQSATLTSLTEGLPKKVRAGSLGLIYAFAISIFGGSTQFTVAWLTKVLHSNLAPAWYMTAGVSIGLVTMLFLPETAPLVHRIKPASPDPAPDIVLV